MIVRLDPAQRTPPYQQIVEQVLVAVALGELSPEDRLPPIRQLAVDLDVAPGTVARAYRELEQSGAVVTRGRRGTFVLGAGAAGPAGAALPASAHAGSARPPSDPVTATPTEATSRSGSSAGPGAMAAPVDEAALAQRALAARAAAVDRLVADAVVEARRRGAGPAEIAAAMARALVAPLASGGAPHPG